MLVPMILCLKMFLRRSGAICSIITLALLIAILVSLNTVVNHLALQVETLGSLIAPTGSFVILGKSSTALTDSRIDADLASKLTNLNYFEYFSSQLVLIANLTNGNAGSTVKIRGLVDVGDYLKSKGAYVNGTTVKNSTEANVGEILARAMSITIGDKVVLAIGNKQAEINIVGVHRSQTACDAELLIPIETARALTGDNNSISLIEFTIKKDVDVRQALKQIVQLLPENVKLVQVQQLKEFAQQVNMQMVTFLDVWSIAVYAVVAAASYVIATRLITESSYELTMLKTLGAKKHLKFILIITYTITVALLGAILGTSLGTAGTQAAATLLRWVKPSLDITPFLEPHQALKILMLTVIASTIGCIYPALKTTRTKFMEQTL